MIKYIKSSESNTAEWIHENDDHSDWFVCSNCGYGDEGELQGSNPPWFKYCPNCGKKMLKG